MAFWRPWEHETALDLSVNSASRSGRASSAPHAEAPKNPYYGYIQHQPSYHAGPVAAQVKPILPSPPDSVSQESVDSLSGDEEYLRFERESFEAMAAKTGGSLLGHNPRMRRQVQPSQMQETDAYARQRHKNNIAAKQSRDKRKLREARLAVQVTYLKKQVAELKAKVNKGVCAKCKQSCK